MLTSQDNWKQIQQETCCRNAGPTRECCILGRRGRRDLCGPVAVHMTAASALALEWRFEESRRVLLDMLDCKRKPDMITYRTLLEEMCRAAQTEEAFELLEDLKGRKRGALDISAASG